MVQTSGCQQEAYLSGSSKMDAKPMVGSSGQLTWTA